MAGYSKSSLDKKLGIKSGAHVFFQAAPKSVLAELKAALAETKVVKKLEKNLDFIHVFVREQSSLRKDFALWKKHLAKTGALWISWPKRTSGIESDLSDQVVREIGLAKGLVDIKVCAVDEQWSGLKFVWRREDR